MSRVGECTFTLLGRVGVFIDLLRLGKVIVPLLVSTDYYYKVVVVPFADFRCIVPSYMPVPQTTLVHSVRFTGQRELEG
jgi:hypothetical protein